MKKKISIIMMCCVMMVFTLSGCANYSKVSDTLESIEIENTLPIVDEDVEFDYLDEIDDLVYEQQLNACEMYLDTYQKTYYKQFQDGEYNDDKLAKLCNAKRQEINIDIEVAFDINIYRLLQGVIDCTNRDAYVLKAHGDVADFYDIYGEYEYGEDPEGALVQILKEYADRVNILAFNFLNEHDREVFKAATAAIEENSRTDEEFRLKINDNNTIIKALNTVYGGVPEEYMERIDAANRKIARKFIMSVEKISDEEREFLIKQFELETSANPSASPAPTMVPSTSTPAPTQAAPTMTPKPLATAVPATPKPTAKPTATPRPVTPVPATAVPVTPVPAPTATPYEPIFGVDSNGGNNNGGSDADVIFDK